MELKLVAVVVAACFALGGYAAFAFADTRDAQQEKTFKAVDAFCRERLDALSVVRVYFYTSASCGPCRLVRPVVDDLIAKGYNIRIVDANCRDGHDFATRFQLTATPSFVCVRVDKDGTERAFDKWVGGDDAKQKILSAFIFGRETKGKIEKEAR